MFRVEWIQSALDDLITIWTGADSTLRQAVNAAANAIDVELKVDPFRRTESRGEGERIFFAYPLGAEIEVDPQKGIVWILHVWRVRRRGEEHSG